MNTELIITAALLGVGLAMDAFSVSLANGLADRNMNKGRMMIIAGTFAGFQFAMPLIGWVFVHRAEEKLEWFGGIVPWIALGLLLFIGGKMLKEGLEDKRLRSRSGESAANVRNSVSSEQKGRTDVQNSSSVGDEANSGSDGEKLGAGELMMQGIATSIDALSVGFTIASYALIQAFASSLIIGAVTFVICAAGLAIGRRMGTLLAGRASILGGLILIGIGLEIWLKGVIL